VEKTTTNKTETQERTQLAKYMMTESALLTLRLTLSRLVVD
jgi:hypothetical protein